MRENYSRKNSQKIYTLPRLYVEAELAQDSVIDLPKEQAHYLGTVLRKGEGDELRIFNGNNGEWQAVITVMSRKSAALEVINQLRKPQPCPDIILCFALVRKHRMNFIIEKATELGVSRLKPLMTARTQFPKFNSDKARLQIIEASEQTERMDIPVIDEAQKLEACLKSWDGARNLIFADEAGDALPALTALQNKSGPAAILIGPEGGFTSQEREQLRALPFVMPVSLGPRILRADTAALSLLTLWQAAQGDWV